MHGEGLGQSWSGDPVLRGPWGPGGPRGRPDLGYQHGPWVGTWVSSSSRVETRGQPR